VCSAKALGFRPLPAVARNLAASEEKKELNTIHETLLEATAKVPQLTSEMKSELKEMAAAEHVSSLWKSLNDRIVPLCDGQANNRVWFLLRQHCITSSSAYKFLSMCASWLAKVGNSDDLRICATYLGIELQNQASDAQNPANDAEELKNDLIEIDDAKSSESATPSDSEGDKNSEIANGRSGRPKRRRKEKRFHDDLLYNSQTSQAASPRNASGKRPRALAKQKNQINKSHK